MDLNTTATFMPPTNFTTTTERIGIAFKNSLVFAVLVFVLPTVLLVIGYFGNTVTIIILSKKNNRASSTAILFLGLAVSDFLVLTMNIVPLLAFEIFNVPLKQLMGCNLHLFFQVCGQQATSWILVLVTLERIIYIKLPLRAADYCNARCAARALFVLTALLVLANGHVIFGMSKDCSFKSDTYGQFYEKSFQIWMDCMLAFLIPATLIVSGNLFICVTMARRTSLQKKRGLVKQGSRTQTNVTRTLILVSCVYIGTISPWTIYHLLANQHVINENFVVRISLAVLGVVNSTVNFFIYVFKGQRFRKEVKALFCCKSTEAHGGVFGNHRPGAQTARSMPTISQAHTGH